MQELDGKERGRPAELRIYSPQEAPFEVFVTLMRNISIEKHYRGIFEDLKLTIVDGNEEYGEKASLTCKGAYLHNDTGNPVIIAFGRINDPAQLSEKGDTLLFARPNRFPPDEIITNSYLTENLTPIAYEHDPRLLARNLKSESLSERLRISGLIIGRGRYNRFSNYASGGFISVDITPENYTWPQFKKTWSQRMVEISKITDGFILGIAQEIGKEIGIEVTSR